MKRFLLSLICSLYLLGVIAQPQEAKYVFFMIGDGMGANQVATTEYYRGASAGINGVCQLTMTQFPYLGLARTYSLSNEITDSSAAGTALSTGYKTANGVLGMDSACNVALTSIAEKAKAQGRAVGIATSVSIDHATPGAFYAHQPNRSMYYEVGKQLAQSGFDFFAGADFLSPTGKNKTSTHLHQILQDSGYTILKGYPAYQQKGKKCNKIFLTQLDGKGSKHQSKSRASIPYAIDRKESDLTIEQITASAIEFLESKENGFFLMVEGGSIDWACHSNDAATVVREVEAFDNAIRLAYEFYLQHPDETLIVVTADHETGGLGLGAKGYFLYLENLATQQHSQPTLTTYMNQAINNEQEPFTWEKCQMVLRDALGFWESITLSPKQEEELHNAYLKTVEGKAQQVKSEYFTDNFIAATAIKILNHNAKIGWTTGDHSGAPVPVYAIGVGAEAFSGVMENCEIPRRIAKIARY